MVITGTSGNDRGPTALVGTDFADTINGLAGNDDLYGLGGNDILSGGLGADTIDGGAGSDTVSYAYSLDGVDVSLVDGTASGAAGDKDTLYGIESVWGSEYADDLIGRSGGQSLSGRGGDDILEGRGGADALSGGDGYNSADYAASSAGVTVNLATGVGTGGDAGGDSLFSIERVFGSQHANSITGSSASNELWGIGGDDTLRGGGGADLLHANGGEDTLWGGSGADRFIFEEGASAPAKVDADVIKDWNDQQGDIINLSSFGSPIPFDPAEWSFKFVGTQAFSAEHQVRVIQEGDDTLVGLNVTGSSGAEEWIRLEGIHALDAGDFYL